MTEKQNKIAGKIAFNFPSDKEQSEFEGMTKQLEQMNIDDEQLIKDTIIASKIYKEFI